MNKNLQMPFTQLVSDKFPKITMVIFSTGGKGDQCGYMDLLNRPPMGVRTNVTG